MKVDVLGRNGVLRKFADIKNDVYRMALIYCRGDVTETARALGVTKVTLYAIVRAAGVDIEQVRKDARK